MSATQNQAPAQQSPPRLSLAQMIGVMRVEFQRARAQRYPLCCVMVAVDGSAEIQALHGVEGRDAAVAAVYELLKSVARQQAFIGMAVRSGDRVMAVFPNTSIDRCAEFGNVILERARVMEFSVGEERIPLTLSLGAAHNLLAETNSSFEGLVEMSGRALYLAAENKGDRYVMWRAAETEIDGLRTELAETKKRFAEERESLEIEASNLGGLQQAEMVAKIEAIFADYARTPDVDAILKRVVELATHELYEERRKAVAAQMAEHQRQSDMMERRIAKLTSILGVTEQELKRVMALKNIDAGVASIYRTVQGLGGTDQQNEAKKSMMADIFHQNLAIQKRTAAAPAAA